MPSPSDTSVRTNPVCGLRAVTVTPGTAAPCVSTMRPVMLPVVCCANAMAGAMNAPNTIIATMIFFICQAPLETNQRSRPHESGAAEPVLGFDVMCELAGVQRLILRQIAEVYPASCHSSQQNFSDDGTGDGTPTQTRHHRSR